MGGIRTLSHLSPECIPSSVSRLLIVQLYEPYIIPLRSHTVLQLTKVNTYGLLYVWPGSNESLKPILLMAHQGTFTI